MSKSRLIYRQFGSASPRGVKPKGFRVLDVQASRHNLYEIRRLIDRDGVGARNFHLIHFIFHPGAKMDRHYHQFEQAYFTIKGKGVVTANGVDQSMIPGNITWLPPGCVHETKCPGPENLVYVNVSSPPASDFPPGAVDPFEEGERLDPSKWTWRTKLGEPKTFHIEDQFPTPGGLRRGFNIHSVPEARNFHLVHMELDPERKFPRHWHDFEQAYLTLSGKGVTRINGVDHPMETGWVTWLPPGCVHETFNPKANTEQLRYVIFSSPPASSFPEGDHLLEDIGKEVARVTGGGTVSGARGG